MYASCEGRRPVAEQVLRAVQRWLPQQRHAGKVAVLLTLGTPNIGKSSLVNQLKAHAVREGLLAAQRVGRVQVGPEPGVTKQVSGIKVRELAAHARWRASSSALWCTRAHMSHVTERRPGELAALSPSALQLGPLCTKERHV